jgi:hypothetical protein
MRAERFLLSIAIVLTMTAPASPQIVMHAVDCGTWIKAREGGNATHLEWYIIGLLDGMTAASNVSVRGTKANNYSDDQIFYWIDKYCKNKPLEILPNGMVDFADEVTNGTYSQTIKK